MPGVLSSMLNTCFFRIIIGLVTGFALLLAGGFSISRANPLRANGVEAEGRVVSIRVVVRKRGFQNYPMVKFTDAQGEEHQKEMSCSSYNEGDSVTVLYLPDNPDVADIKSAESPVPVFGYTMLWLSFIGWGIAGYYGVRFIRSKKQPA